MNVSGPQEQIKFCPICRGKLRNIPRAEMATKGHVRSDGTISEYTHTYQCTDCDVRFEINQRR